MHVNCLQCTSLLKTPTSCVSAHFSSVSVLFFSLALTIINCKHDLIYDQDFQWVMVKGRGSWLMFKWANKTKTFWHSATISLQVTKFKQMSVAVSLHNKQLLHWNQCCWDESSLFLECVILKSLFYIKTTLTTQYQFASFLLSWCTLVILQNI